MSDNIKVVIRVRPLIEREQKCNQPVKWQVENKAEIRLIPENGGPTSQTVYDFDRVFDSHSSNLEVYDETVKPIVLSAMQGFNGTIFAFGQTSSGKTYTIMGSEQNWGIIPCTIEEIFETIENTPNRLFLLRVSYMEIYNENVTDLLNGQTKLKIHENAYGNVYVGGLSEEIVRDPSMIFDLIEKGEARRHVGETDMNDRSSRSHTIFRIIIESREINNEDMEEASVTSGQQQTEQVVTVSHLNIVDLAGSERVSETGATGDRFKEGCSINKSLFTLAHVISKLSQSGNAVSSNVFAIGGADGPFVNFRDSKLTRILQNSLGGNSKTAIICTITPAVVGETQSTLRFASRAKVIKNKPVKNEVGSDEAMLRRYQKQINELKSQISELMQSSNVHELKMEKDNLSKQLDEKEEKIAQLMKLICISSKIVLSPRSRSSRNQMRNRRITWCPGSRNSLAPAGFSPFLFKRPAQLEVLNENDSFVSVDLETLNKELEVVERRKNLEFRCTSTSNPIAANFQRRSFNSLVPTIKELRTPRITVDACSQTDDDNSDIVVKKPTMVENDNSNNDIQRAEMMESDTMRSYVEEIKALRSEILFLADLNEQLANENDRLSSSLNKSHVTGGGGKQHNETAQFCENELNLLREDQSAEIEALKAELSKKEQLLTKMTKELSDANEQCEELFMQNWQLNKKVGSLTHDLKQKETVIETSQSESKKNQEQIMESLKEQFEKDVECLKEQHVKEMEALKSNLSESDSHVTELTNQLSEANEQISNHEQIIKLLTEQFEKDTEIMKDQLTKQIEALISDLTESNNHVIELTNQLSEASEQNLRLQGQIPKKEQFEKDVEAMKEQFVEEMETLKSALSKSESHVIELTNQLSEVSEQNLRLKDQIPEKEQYEKYIEDMKEQFGKEIEAFKSYLSESENHVTSLTGRLSEASEENLRLKEQISDYERILKNVESMEERFVKEVEALKSDLSESENHVTSLTNQLSEANEQNLRLKDQISEKEQFEKDVEAMKEQFVKEVETLKSDLSESENHVTSLTNRLSEASEQNLRHKEQISDYERILKNVESMEEQFVKEVETLKSDLSESENHVTSLTNRLSEASEQNLQLNEQIFNLSQEQKRKQSILETAKTESKQKYEKSTLFLKQQFYDEIETLKADWLKTNDHVTSLTSQLSEAKQQQEKLTLQNWQLNKKVSGLMNELKEKAANLDSCQTENKHLRAKYTEMVKKQKETVPANNSAAAAASSASSSSSRSGGGTLCRGSGIVEDYNVYMLDNKVYHLEKRLKKMQTELDEANRQRNEALEKVKILQNAPQSIKICADAEKPTNAAEEPKIYTDKNPLADKENLRPSDIPMPPVSEKPKPPKSTTVFMTPTPEKSQRETMEKCRQQ